MRKDKEEPVEMQEKRYGYFPQAFMWRGKCYRVSQVEKSWTICKRERKIRKERRCFRVRCEEGTFVLNHDLIVNIWQLSRIQM